MRVSRNAIVTTALSLLAIAATTAFAFRRIAPIPALSATEARALVTAQWGGCSGSDCTSLTVDVTTDRLSPTVTATYTGYQDDSVRGMRIAARAKLDPTTGTWSLEEISREWSCQPDRGHREWSIELCD